MDSSPSQNEQELIYDWNVLDFEPMERTRPVQVNDETLRDGLQSASVTDPSLEQKLELVHLMHDLGIHSANIGLPGASRRMYRDSLAIAEEVRDQKLDIDLNCAARTVIGDITPIVEISQKTGLQLEAAMFIGSSPIRRYVEEWTVEQMLGRVEEAITYAKKNNLRAMFVTEDTTRAHPETLRKLYQTAIDCGAERLCICDTVGHATPHGVKKLVSYIRGIAEASNSSAYIDWHGHRDRGLSVANALAAIEAGADRIHGTALGVGERCGNAQMELLLVNLRLAGYIENDLTKLGDYCRFVADALNVRMPDHQPVVGPDAFRTCTGVHASALLKAERKGHRWLADRVYSAVPAEWVGQSQTVEVGPLSGASNVVCWLQANGHEAPDALVKAILSVAKEQDRRIPDEAMTALVEEFSAGDNLS